MPPPAMPGCCANGSGAVVASSTAIKNIRAFTARGYNEHERLWSSLARRRALVPRGYSTAMTRSVLQVMSTRSPTLT